jgi:hypothetical protein
MAITQSMKAIDDSLKITRIEPKSSTQEMDILNMPQLLFEKPPIRIRGVPQQIVEERYYALRFTFIDSGSEKRYCFYKVISCDEPYLLLIESPAGFGWSKPPGLPDAALNNALFGPLKLILANQRLMHQTYAEREYIPSRT